MTSPDVRDLKLEQDIATCLPLSEVDDKARSGTTGVSITPSSSGRLRAISGGESTTSEPMEISGAAVRGSRARKETPNEEQRSKRKLYLELLSFSDQDEVAAMPVKCNCEESASGVPADAHIAGKNMVEICTFCQSRPCEVKGMDPGIQQLADADRGSRRERREFLYAFYKDGVGKKRLRRKSLCLPFCYISAVRAAVENAMALLQILMKQQSSK